MMYKKISAVDTAFLLENNSKVAMLHVREKDELSICHIERALHIPIAEIPNRYKELPKNVPLIVFCHHGMRSLKVVQYLQEKGFQNAFNLTGGINDWANTVDRKMPQY